MRISDWSSDVCSSDLSIMEWAPLSGALPPLSQAEWERLFDLYRQIPEYRQVNAGMDLAAFKTIFWWEYIHRLWGRLIGLVFRSEEHTSELQSLMRISYAVFCLKKKTKKNY